MWRDYTLSYLIIVNSSWRVVLPSLLCVYVEDIPNVVQTVTLHRVILRSLAELSQFKDGIEALGVGKVMNVHSHLLYDFFVQGKDPLTAGVVHHLNRIGARMYKC